MSVAETMRPAGETVVDPALLGREYVASLAPFTVRRIVRWTECDPAGVVYLGNFPEYLISAVHLFRDRLFGRGWITNDRKEGYQAPGKAISLVFQSSLWPDEIFDMAVYVGPLRSRTMSLLVQARRADNGKKVFAGRVTSIFVTRDDREQTVGIPDALREELERYSAENPAPPELAASLREPE
ncbi:MAG TPA: acyl-CoA thioesterase [Pseudolabrys sp.]|nr:acyl-CoA thioesterase [Pseudolabrys sp.]